MAEPYFISYSSVDGPQWADRLVTALASPPDPIAVWLDKPSLHPGEDWDDQIQAAIEHTPALLFLVTEDSVHPYSVCKNEWTWALKNERPVIPLRFDRHAELPFRLASREYIDFADSFDNGLKRLRSHLSWMSTPAGRRREIEHQLLEAERRLPRAEGADRDAIEHRLVELRAQLDGLSPPGPDHAPVPAPPPAPAEAPRHRPPARPLDRRDPVAILEEQASEWEPDLAPVRLGRMLTSPYNFHRGAGAVMAADLASLPSSGIVVQACGDAALMSFAFVATAPTQVVFDIVSFDHTLRAPFEWDLKRLAASVALAAYDVGRSSDTAERVATETAKAYRESMARFARISPFEVLQQPIEAAERALPVDAPKDPEPRQAWLARRFRKSAASLTEGSAGARRLVDYPPLIRRVDEPAFAAEVREAYDGYLRSLPDQVGAYLQRYELVDQARQIVGVEGATRGDVLMLLVRPEDGDELPLRLTRPRSSVLEPYVDANPYSSEAERVVRGERLLQAAADTYLGWTATPDGGSRYVRRLRSSLSLAWHEQPKSGKFLANAGRACATALARGHARSGGAEAIADHLGDDPAFDQAIARFALGYAEQTQSDYAAFSSAVRSGRLPATVGQ